MTDQSETEPDYADALEAQMLVDYVREGMTLIDACKVLGLYRQQIYRAMEKSERFRDMMEKARLDGYDAIANQVLAIADDSDNDYEEGVDRFGNPKLFLNKEHIQRSKLRAEVRMKLLAKWHPKKYGEKLEIEQKTATVAIPVGDDPIAAQRAYEDLMKS